MFPILVVVLLFALLCGVAPKIAGGLILLVIGLAALTFSLLLGAAMFGWTNTLMEARPSL
jgi:hypothetical protein